MRVCCSPTPSKCSHRAMEGQISRSSSVLPPSESLTHPGNAPELPRWDQPSPAVLGPRGEATKACGTKGWGHTSPTAWGTGTRGKPPQEAPLFNLNLRKDKQQEVREPPSCQGLAALRTSSADREKRDLERGSKETQLPQSHKRGRAGKGSLLPLPPHPSALRCRKADR